MNDVLVCITADGWYTIQGVDFVPLKKQAEDTGVVNAHLRRIEDVNGNVLWTREN